MANRVKIYRKRPQDVQAFHYRGREDYAALREFMNLNAPQPLIPGSFQVADIKDDTVTVTNDLGVRTVGPGDYVVATANGYSIYTRREFFTIYEEAIHS